MLKYFYKKEGAHGFTLIELLVVIAIIGVLASIVLASLGSARKKGRDARRIADLRSVQLAMELYFDSKGSYNGTGSAIATGPLDNLSGMLTGTNCGGSSCIATMPSDPLNSGSYIYSVSNIAVGAATYTIKAVLEENSNAALKSDFDAADSNGLNCGSSVGNDTDAIYCLKS